MLTLLNPSFRNVVSVVLPLPPPSPPSFAASEPPSLASSPSPSSARLRSRPCTPPIQPAAASLRPHLYPVQTISAPPTPVTTTHLIPLSQGMERCRSSEAVLGRPVQLDERDRARERHTEPDRSGRTRQPKPLLFAPMPRDPSEPALSRHASADRAREWASRMEKTASKDGGDAMDIDEVVAEVHVPSVDEAIVHGMPKWGYDDERPEVRPGVRLVGMEELPALIERHSLTDTPSQLLFPWLHGISDDGLKGREMASFFGYAAPFEPPPYRGLCLMLAPSYVPGTPARPGNHRTDTEATTLPSYPQPQPQAEHDPLPPSHPTPIPRERSETMSTTSESYSSIAPTDLTTPSLSESKFPTPDSPSTSSSLSMPETPATPEGHDSALPGDVAMHPLESKRVSPKAKEQGLDHANGPLPCEMPDSSVECSSEEGSYVTDEDSRPSCILLNALHALDVFDLRYNHQPRFRPARLPQQINLRNLHIQQIKYASVSDLIVYAKHGVGPGVLEIAGMIAEAQETLYNERMDEFYRHMNHRGRGEGIDRPVRYGVWVVVEPFARIEKFCPQLVNIDSLGNLTGNSTKVDLFEREAFESRAMTRGSEVVENFWVGNDCDVPGGADDGAGSKVTFDLCVRASECCEMPSASTLTAAYRQLVQLSQPRPTEPQWTASPATLALRNLLSPSQPTTPSSLTPVPSTTGLELSSGSSKRVASPSPDSARQQPRPRSEGEGVAEYVSLECSGSCRTITGQMRSLAAMTERVVDLVYFLRKIVEGRDKTGIKRRVLVHCQDGYTESSILVLSFIMASLSISLPEAYLHLQNTAKRSFFLYPSDKPLLRRIEARLLADRRERAIKTVRSNPTISSFSFTPASGPSAANSSATSPTSAGSSGSASAGPSPSSGSKWRPWPFSSSARDSGASLSLGLDAQRKKDAASEVVDTARKVLVEEGDGPSERLLQCKVWFDDKRFDGFPSRILPFLYLGNLEHAGNAAMLHALDITHVVSVGENLIDCPDDTDPMYGFVGPNTLAAEFRSGKIQVLDLADIRDDGNDPLRPMIARACAWIEKARLNGGTVLVHCRVGVSRSASIVIAYLMQHQNMALMDAYLFTRARRLNVLIQPNLRFFHELFGWEVELARKADEDVDIRRQEADAAGVRDLAALSLIDATRRRPMYSWPAFCRDVHCLNRRFLCN